MALSFIVACFVLPAVSAAAVSLDVPNEVTSVDIPAEMCLSDALLEKTSSKYIRIPEQSYVIHGGAALSVWFRALDLNRSASSENHREIVASAIEIQDLDVTVTNGDVRTLEACDIYRWQTSVIREAVREFTDDAHTPYIDFEPFTDMMWDAKYYGTKEKMLARFGADEYQREIPFAHRPNESFRRVLSVAHPRVTLGWHIDTLSFQNFVYETQMPEERFAEKMKRRLNRVKAYLIASDVFGAKEHPTSEEKMFILDENDPLRVAARVLLRSGFAKIIERGDWSYAKTIERVQEMFEGQGLFLDWTL